MVNFQDEIDASDITEKDLEEIGWVRVCGNLTRYHARQMTAINPDHVIVQDNLNDGMWIVMKKEKDLNVKEDANEQKGTEDIRPDHGQVQDPASVV